MADERSPGVGLAAGSVFGSRLAGYRLERRIGAGGTALVFLARDERLGLPVALKILTPAVAADEAFRHRFIRESRAAGAVADPHIIPVYGVGETDGVLYLAIRYVRGGDVGSLVRRAGPLPAARVVPIICPVASALDAAHAAGLVHQNVKPANMLLEPRPGRPDHVFLSDFGLSKDMQPGLRAGPGRFPGTPHYTAPEQIAGWPVDGRADQYALACAAFEMLAGEVPFAPLEGSAVIGAHMNSAPPALADRRPDLPPAVSPVLARAMAKAPHDRFGSCRQFADALCDALGLEPYDPGPAETSAALRPAAPDQRRPEPAGRASSRRPRRPSRRRRLVAVVLIMTAVLAAAAVAAAML